MLSKKALEYVVLSLWILIAVTFYYNRGAGSIVPVDPPISQYDNDKQKQTEEKINIKKIVVLSSNSFDFTLKDDQNTRILGKLSGLVAEDAKQKIIDLMNEISNPQIKLKEKQSDGKWIVDVFFVLNGQEQDLFSWLQSKNLIYK